MREALPARIKTPSASEQAGHLEGLRRLLAVGILVGMDEQAHLAKVSRDFGQGLRPGLEAKYRESGVDGRDRRRGRRARRRKHAGSHTGPRVPRRAACWTASSGCRSLAGLAYPSRRPTREPAFPTRRTDFRRATEGGMGSLKNSAYEKARAGPGMVPCREA